MTNLFFKDARGNYWSVNKVIGFVRDVATDEEGKEVEHFLAIVEGGMSVEITQVLFTELTKSLIVLESTEEA